MPSILRKCTISVFASMIIMLIFLPGCYYLDSEKHAALEFVKNDTTPTMQKDCVIDLGIVFRNEPAYFCWPLSSLGISSDEEAIDVKSSCKCLRPLLTKVNYADEPVPVLRVDFVPETPSDENDVSQNPTRLAVQLIFTMSDMSTKDVTINLVEAIPASRNP